MKFKPLLFLLLLPGFFFFMKPENTVELIVNTPDAYEGYTLFSPINVNTTYLIDNFGKIINKWEGQGPPGASAYLFKNNTLFRSEMYPFIGPNHPFHYGGAGGKIKEYTYEGDLIWEFTYSNETHLLHHDFEIMPNGNLILIAWEKKTKDEAINEGRNPKLIAESEGELWPDHIIEIKPTLPFGGEIVWEWHVWDHLIQDFDNTKNNYGVVSNHPEKIDLNYVWNFGGNDSYADWNHLNSIDYNQELDQIILSNPFAHEVWIIDHNTTTQEARGKKGDLLYRWGNPQAYGRGSKSNQKFFLQHDVQWIEKGLPGEGDILIFDNGFRRPEGNYSSVLEFRPPMKGGKYYLENGTYGPKNVVWEYVAKNKTDFYSSVISGAQRLPNGNTLICSGVPGIIFEIDSDKNIVWEYINPYTSKGKVKDGQEFPVDESGSLNKVFNARKYSKSLFD